MSNGPLEEDAMDLRRLLRLLRAGWITVVIAMVVGCGLGGLAYTRTTPRYSAEATLLFSLRSTASLSALSEGNVYMQSMMPSYVQVIDTPLVLEPVISSLDLGITPHQLSDKISVSNQLDSVVAQIDVVDDDPRQAADIANAVAKQVEFAAFRLAPPGGDQLGHVTATQISDAVPPASPFAPLLWVDLLLGAGLGLLAGIAALVVWDATVTSRVDSRYAVARATRAPVVGTVPSEPLPGALPIAARPLSARAESYRFLQSNLAGPLAEPRLCLLVTSPGGGEGATVTAANFALAVALSSADRRGPLVAAPPGHPPPPPPVRGPPPPGPPPGPPGGRAPRAPRRAGAAPPAGGRP